MNYNEKREFLEHCKETAMELEEKTATFYEILIGWIQAPIGDLPVTIMLNHEKYWFGDNEGSGWNTQVVFDDAGRFIPVKEDYLILNELIEKVYKE